MNFYINLWFQILLTQYIMLCVLLSWQRRHRRRVASQPIARETKSSPTCTEVADLDLEMRTQQRLYMTKSKQRKLKRSIQLVLFIAIVFCIFCMPYTFVTNIYVFCGDVCGVSEKHFVYASTLITFHGFVNFFIFISKNKEFRRTLKQLFCNNTVGPLMQWE